MFDYYCSKHQLDSPYLSFAICCRLMPLFASGYQLESTINNEGELEMRLSYVATMACIELITGCVITTSPSELRNDVTPIEYSSVKSAKVLALCVSDEWEKKLLEL
jgi:hypothetical protein